MRRGYMSSNMPNKGVNRIQHRVLLRLHWRYMSTTYPYTLIHIFADDYYSATKTCGDGHSYPNGLGHLLH